MPKITLLSALLSTLVPSIGASIIQSRDSCTNFTVSKLSSGDISYTQPGLQTFPVSKGVVCTGSTDCSVDVGGFVTDQRTLNITADSPVFSIIIDTTGIPFNESLTGNVTTTPWPISNGTSGYVGFTPIHRCVAGTLSGCSGHISDGTAVEACTPYALDDTKDSSGHFYLHGEYNAVVTNEQTAEALTCNPANTTSAENGQNSNNCTGNSDSTSNSTSDSNTNSAASVGQPRLYPLALCALAVPFLL